MRINKCPICGSTDIIEVQKGISKCKNCTHGFRNEISDTVLPKYYDRTYWERDKNRQGIMEVKPSEEWTRWVRARLKILDGFGLPEGEPAKTSVLEFGCAEGMLLYALKQRGYNVMGNDVCAIADEGIKEYGIDISREDISEFSKEDYQFDLIMSFHTVEHLIDPLSVMKNLTHMLKTGGSMLLHVPVDDQEFGNIDHYQFFTNESCLALMEQITTDIRSDFVHYPIKPGASAMAATYVGIKRKDFEYLFF